MCAEEMLVYVCWINKKLKDDTGNRQIAPLPVMFSNLQSHFF